jgi:hypothetical protein
VLQVKRLTVSLILLYLNVRTNKAVVHLFYVCSVCTVIHSASSGCHFKKLAGCGSCHPLGKKVHAYAHARMHQSFFGTLYYELETP